MILSDLVATILNREGLPTPSTAGFGRQALRRKETQRSKSNLSQTTSLTPNPYLFFR
jgi:hypothetical protein